MNRCAVVLGSLFAGYGLELLLWDTGALSRWLVITIGSAVTFALVYRFFPPRRRPWWR